MADLGSFDYEMTHRVRRGDGWTRTAPSLRATGGLFRVKGGDGLPYAQTTGTRRQVWEHVAFKTAGGLTKNFLKKNASGAIVSKAASAAARSRNAKPGSGFRKYLAKKGSGVFVQHESTGKYDRTRVRPRRVQSMYDPRSTIEYKEDPRGDYPRLAFEHLNTRRAVAKTIRATNSGAAQPMKLRGGRIAYSRTPRARAPAAAAPRKKKVVRERIVDEEEEEEEEEPRRAPTASRRAGTRVRKPVDYLVRGSS